MHNFKIVLHKVVVKYKVRNYNYIEKRSCTNVVIKS